MNVKVSIQLNQKAIDTLSKAAINALAETTEAIADDVIGSATIPKRTGALEESTSIDISDLQNGHTAVTFERPYALIDYYNPYGWNFHGTYNKLAQQMWMQTYIDGYKQDFAKNTFIRSFKEMSGGIVK
ncbi:MAG: hypothetical protein K0S61_4030 [Anaerocolumna sp.]|jgi:hypothetical protein|nr:hypothetical protein [Anaerocolumna sp.]